MMTRSQPPATSNADKSSGASQAFAPSDVLVFVEDMNVSEAGMRHAQNVAQALGGTVELLQVLCKPANGDAPIDPVEWDIKKKQALKRLGSLGEKFQSADTPCHVRLLEGKCSSQIRSLMALRSGDVAASMRSRSDGGWYLSETAWAVMMSQSAAVLMIPDAVKTAPDDTAYRRILVPLDGSLRAEAVLPVAVKIAQAQNAELMLCYAPGGHGLTEIDTNGQEAADLHAQIHELNAKAGKTYLDRTSRRLERNGLSVSIKIPRGGGDVRRSLIDIITREKADFVVMATHGQSGHRDVPTGDVARFVLEKADVPVLLVRSRNGHEGTHTFGKLSAKGVRQPAGTD